MVLDFEPLFEPQFLETTSSVSALEPVAPPWVLGSGDGGNYGRKTQQGAKRAAP